MKKLAMIVAVAGMVIAVSGTAQATMIIAPCNEAGTDWIPSYDSVNVETSSDFLTGTGSIMWDKHAGELMWNKSGVQRLSLEGAPINASIYPLTGTVHVTFKMPDVAVCTGSFLQLGTDMYNCVEYQWDASGIVEDEWITVSAVLGDPNVTKGTGLNMAGISFARFCFTISPEPSTVENMLLDQIMIVPEPATLALLAFGGIGLLIRRKRR